MSQTLTTLPKSTLTTLSQRPPQQLHHQHAARYTVINGSMKAFVLSPNSAASTSTRCLPARRRRCPLDSITVSPHGTSVRLASNFMISLRCLLLAHTIARHGVEWSPPLLATAAAAARISTSLPSRVVQVPHNLYTSRSCISTNHVYV